MITLTASPNRTVKQMNEMFQRKKISLE